MHEYGYFWFYLLLFAFLLLNALLLFRQWKSGSRVRLIVGNLLVFFFLLFATFLVAEGYFSFFWDTTDGAMAFLTSRRWVDRHVKRNELNFRGKMPPQMLPRGVDGMRICVLGDSFTWGQGIDREADRFPELLEAKLRRAGQRVSVFNVSDTGWSTSSELHALQLFKQKGITFDMIILAYVLNDHFDAWLYPQEYQAALTRARNPSPWIKAIVNRSFTCSFLYQVLVTFRDPSLSTYNRMMLDLYRDPEVWRQHVEKLKKLKEACDQEGMQLAVATFPMVNPLWDRHEFDRVERELDALWQLLGVRNVDLRKSYDRYPARELIVNKWDTHPGLLAHRLAADQLAAELFGVR